jgi:hypothetical protein
MLGSLFQLFSMNVSIAENLSNAITSLAIKDPTADNVRAERELASSSALTFAIDESRPFTSFEFKQRIERDPSQFVVSADITAEVDLSQQRIRKFAYFQLA